MQLSEALKDLHNILPSPTGSDPAIRVRELFKKYQPGGPQENYYALRDAIVNISAGAVQAMHPGPSF